MANTIKITISGTKNTEGKEVIFEIIKDSLQNFSFQKEFINAPSDQIQFREHINKLSKMYKQETKVQLIIDE